MSELERLQSQVAEMSQEIALLRDELHKERKGQRLASACTTKPIDGCSYIAHEDVIVAHHSNSEAWQTITRLVRIMFRKVSFNQREPRRWKDYYDPNWSKPMAIAALDAQQFDIAIRMANEVSEIYNRYWLEAHPMGDVRHFMKEPIQVKIEHRKDWKE